MNTLPMLADLTETIAVGIPIVMLMIPIVAILTHHQRKMAEIIHGRGQNTPQVTPTSNPEIAALRAEVYELKQMVQSQLIAMDSLQNVRKATPPPAPSIEQRLGS